MGNRASRGIYRERPCQDVRLSRNSPGHSVQVFPLHPPLLGEVGWYPRSWILDTSPPHPPWQMAECPDKISKALWTPPPFLLVTHVLTRCILRPGGLSGADTQHAWLRATPPPRAVSGASVTPLPTVCSCGCSHVRVCVSECLMASASETPSELPHPAPMFLGLGAAQIAAFLWNPPQTLECFLLFFLQNLFPSWNQGISLRSRVGPRLGGGRRERESGRQRSQSRGLGLGGRHAFQLSFPQARGFTPSPDKQAALLGGLRSGCCR